MKASTYYLLSLTMIAAICPDSALGQPRKIIDAPSPVPGSISPLVTGLLEGRSRVRDALERLGPGSQRRQIHALSYETSYYFLGHYERPWRQRLYQGSEEILLDSQGRRLQREMRTSSASYDLLTGADDGAVVWQRDESEEDWSVADQASTLQTAIDLLGRSPLLLLEIASRAPDLQLGDGGGDEVVLRFSRDGFPWQLHLARKSNELSKAETLRPDPLYGDVTETFFYRDYQIHEGLRWPTSIEHRALGRVMEELQLRKVAVPSTQIPSPTAKAPAEESASGALTLELTPLQPHLFEVLVPSHDSRLLVVEFEDGLALLDGAPSVPSAQQLLGLLAKEFPTKALRWVLISHHHPHYILGMRTFAHAGAEIIAPEGVQDYLDHLLRRSHGLRPDALGREPKEPTIRTVDSRWQKEDALQDLQAFEIGMDSAHTESFLLFFLPRSGIAFGGDLLWVPREPNHRPLSARTRGLAAAIRRLALPVKTFLTSWPVGEAWPYVSEISKEDFDRQVLESSRAARRTD